MAGEPDLFVPSPLDWTVKMLGEVATFENGDRSANYPKASDFVVSGVPFVNTGDIAPSGRLSPDGIEYISRECFNRLRAGKLRSGDIVYCLRGSTIGKIARVDLPEGAIASSLVIIRAKSDVSQEYIYYYLANPSAQNLAKQHDNGSAQPNLSVQAISRFLLILPSLKEQQAIACILGALDDKIELNRRTNETLEAMARALFQSWFVDFDPVQSKAEGRKPAGLDAATAKLFPDAFDKSALGPVPKGWAVGSVRVVCERIENGGTPKRDVEAFWNPPEVPWLTSGECRQGCIVHTENFISKEGLESSSAKLWPPFTTVVALYGATAGYASILGMQLCANQACCALIPKSGASSFIFLKVRSSLDHFQQQTRGSAQQNLSQSIVADLPTVVPSPEVLTAFESYTRPLFERCVHNLEAQDTLAALRDALLPKLLSGEIRVKDAEKLATGGKP
jgi:type I restriction enzyme S subunit